MYAGSHDPGQSVLPLRHAPESLSALVPNRNIYRADKLPDRRACLLDRPVNLLGCAQYGSMTVWPMSVGNPHRYAGAHALRVSLSSLPHQILFVSRLAADKNSLEFPFLAVTFVLFLHKGPSGFRIKLNFDVFLAFLLALLLLGISLLFLVLVSGDGIIEDFRT